MMREDQRQRILMIFDPSIDPNGTGVRYQTHLSQIYLSAGGLSGQGLGQGVQTQSGVMPAQHTDFIFSVIGNELGMVGCLFTLLILSIILIRCIYVGVKSGSYLNRLICIGIAGMLLFQILVNIGMCLGLFPVRRPDAPLHQLRRQLHFHHLCRSRHRLRHPDAPVAGQ